MHNFACVRANAGDKFFIWKEEKGMKRKIAATIVACLMSACALLPLASCKDGEQKVPLPQWEAQVVLEKDGVTLHLTEQKDADEYKIYHSTSRYGEYRLVSTQTELTYKNVDKYGYYRVEAVKDGKTIAAEELSYDKETFGENTYVYAPEDDATLINADIDEQFKELEAGQFSSRRFGVLFKSGEYPDVKMKTGYYTSVSGLGYSPEDVTLGYFNVNAQWFSGNATHNFWRAVENVTVNGDVQWAVSQATSFRRVNVLGNMQLSDGGWSSGGYIADSKIKGDVDSGSQQQWFTRNSSFTQYRNAGWSRVFVGCEGKTPAGNGVTNIEKAEEISEKPFLIFNGNNYAVFIPTLRTNASGVSWEKKSGEEIEGEELSLNTFYVARADRDTAATINAALANGKNLLFTPGVYKLDEPITVTHQDTVITGIGLATLKVTDKNTETLMRVKDVDGVNISGILFDAGKSSKTLLQIGEKKTSVSHAEDKIYLSDLFFRVGGAEDANTSVDVCIEINSNDVICDHFWIWRADHSHGVGWRAGGTYTDWQGNERIRYGNETKNGIVVNGDNVTAYALMVEHFHEYQTLWNGENGKTYFYQSEVPYDPVQEDWTTSEGTSGYASYKVADDVTTHHAYGVGVYYYQSGCILENAVEAPAGADVYFEHAFVQNLSGNRGGQINNVINGVGGEASSSVSQSSVQYYYNGKIQDKKK